jgi:hypothetical protein
MKLPNVMSSRRFFSSSSWSQQHQHQRHQKHPNQLHPHHHHKQQQQQKQLQHFFHIHHGSHSQEQLQKIYHIMVKLCTILLALSSILLFWNTTSSIMKNIHNLSIMMTTSSTNHRLTTTDYVNDNIDHPSPPLQKPHFVLHVGPPKTATTTIQETLTDWDMNGIMYQHSRYIYLGTYLKATFCLLLHHYQDNTNLKKFFSQCPF